MYCCFLLDVCMLSECKGEDGDGNAGVGEGRVGRRG